MAIMTYNDSREVAATPLYPTPTIDFGLLLMNSDEFPVTIAADFHPIFRLTNDHSLTPALLFYILSADRESKNSCVPRSTWSNPLAIRSG
jgi:hypothetical protein